MSWKPTPPPFAAFKKEVFKKTALASNFIYQIGEYTQLRERSAEVPFEKITSDEMQQKFAYIKKCLRTYRIKTGYGRGIAAVQVGIPERFAVILHKDELVIIVNPKITKRSSKKYLYPEMCMSASPIISPTVRPAWIEFSYFDEKGRENYWDSNDDTDRGKMMNRVFQHEIDHMNGIINIDKVSSKDLILQSDPKFYDSAKFEEV